MRTLNEDAIEYAANNLFTTELGYKNKSRTLSALRDALLPRLMRGKINLS